LFADPERRLQWRALLDSLGPKMKVGIAWTGGNKNTGKARRSVDLYDLLPILRQDATFVSLQYMDSPEVLSLERDHGIKVHHWKRAVQSEDHDDCAALVAELDLVITVQTAIVHLCGALGQTCWAMLPKTPRWFYGITGDSMPWYKSVKLYRQRYKWVDLIAEVGTDLRNLIKTPKAI
jgi:ADP-heptose:LPS heptosyltransferase